MIDSGLTVIPTEFLQSIKRALLISPIDGEPAEDLQGGSTGSEGGVHVMGYGRLQGLGVMGRKLVWSATARRGDLSLQGPPAGLDGD